MVSEALLVRLEAKAGKDAELEEFLKSALSVVRREAGTAAWFAIKFGRSEYGIFDVLPDDQAREAHLTGAVARALKERGEMLLAGVPHIEKVKVLAEKFPITAPTAEVTKGLLVSFKAKSGHEQDVERFLRDARSLVLKEEDTSAWFALQFESGEYGVFDVFPDTGARFRHITGHVTGELAKHAFTLLGSFPELELNHVLAAKLTT